MENKELLLKTAFCCMSCDGEIAPEEIALVKERAENSNLFNGLNVEEKLNEFVALINQIGVSFLSGFLNEIKSASLSEEDELEVAKIAIDTIEADRNIEYSEIKFFKKIRALLSISDGKIEKAYPEREDMDIYLLPDMKEDESVEINATFSKITL